MKRLALFSLILLVGLNVQAQTWKERLEEMEARVQEKMDRQKRSVDLRFNNQMRRLWIEAEVHGADMPFLGPKPVDRPEINPSAPRPKSPAKELIIVPAPETVPVPVPIPERASIPDAEPEPLEPVSPMVESRLNNLTKTVSTSFFGEEIDFRYDPRLRLDPMPVLSEQRIANAWLQLDAADNELLIYQLEREAARRNLNDWGFLQIVNRTAHRFFPNDKNSRTLFNWFVATKAGYAASACYDRDNLYLLMPTNRRLYGATYLKGKEGEKYYAIDLDGGKPELKQCRVFNGKHPEAKRILNLDMYRSPRLKPRLESKTYRFAHKGNTYTVPVTFDKSLVYFYKTMPFFDLDLYMQTPLSETAMASIKRGLKPHMRDMNEQEQVGLILAFVQKAFDYKTDQQQFGGERYLFAEETLYYPYSDCEDRSVLFAQLVQQFTDRDVVGLIFPGHAATAVNFSERIDGDRITYKGRAWTICDPTYINADIGMLLPDARNKQARIIAAK